MLCDVFGKLCDFICLYCVLLVYLIDIGYYMIVFDLYRNLYDCI